MGKEVERPPWFSSDLSVLIMGWPISSSAKVAKKKHLLFVGQLNNVRCRGKTVNKKGTKINNCSDNYTFNEAGCG